MLIPQSYAFLIIFSLSSSSSTHGEPSHLLEPKAMHTRMILEIFTPLEPSLFTVTQDVVNHKIPVLGPRLCLPEVLYLGSLCIFGISEIACLIPNDSRHFLLPSSLSNRADE